MVTTDHTVTEVARNFSDFIDRVSHRGERIRLLRGGRPVAEMGPAPAGRRMRDLPGLLASLPRLLPGDAEALEADLAAAGEILSQKAARDPWVS